MLTGNLNFIVSHTVTYFVVKMYGDDKGPEEKNNMGKRNLLAKNVFIKMFRIL